MIRRLSDPREPDRDKLAYNRPQDDWVDVPLCTTELTCEESELLVTRKRSLRFKRRIFTMSCTAFTIGMLMILMASPFRNEFVVPGPLSSNHAQILAVKGSDRCASCHDAANQSAGSWLAGMFSFSKEPGQTQSELCMKCHDKTLNPEAFLNPHNVPPNHLAEVTSKYKQASFDAGMVFQPPVSGHNIACSACHREHHGAKIDLTAMTDKQCQSCHQKTYHSFELDHPEFVSYPLKRRARIAFDHASHVGQHFPSRGADFNCSQCHIDDDFQNVKKLASYEQACSSCHHQQILESGRDGLTLISLPMLDTDAIESAKLKIGGWPLAATGDFDGPLSPIMRVMLMADDSSAQILNRRGPEFDFADIDPANADDVKDAVELVWAIKRLLYDLALDGPRAVRSRLETVMDLKVSDVELQKMVTNLDEPVFQAAVRRWLPNLNVEVATNRFGAPLKERLADLEMPKSKRFVWPGDEVLSQFAPSATPTIPDDKLLAENPLAGLISTGSQADEPAPIGKVRVPAPAKIKIDTREVVADSSGAGDQPAQETPPVSLRLENMHLDPMSDPDLLAVNPLQNLGQTEDQSVAEAGDPLPVIKSNPEPTAGLVNGPTTGVGEVLNPETAKPKINVAEFVAIDRPPIVVPSGWFRDDSVFKISYRPSGHADPTVQSWIELVTRAVDADTRPETKQLFERTLSMTSIGLCRTCHTVDQLADRSFAVNWKAQYRDPSVRDFTRFAHGPHMIQPNLQDCSHCHSLDPSLPNSESFVGLDATIVKSNFLPMTKSDCATCHAANQTSSGCTQCHNYHVGSKITGSR